VAGVSSFGLSGTNAHIVVAEAPEPSTPAPVSASGPHVLTLSARSAAGLQALAGRYADVVAAHPERTLAHVAFTANTGRAHLDHRLAVVAEDAAQAEQRLRAVAAGTWAAGVQTGHVIGAEPSVAFLFTGHGSHYAGMGKELYASHDIFRGALDRCAELLRDELDVPLLDVLFGDGARLDEMVYAQPALFALQYALAEQWQAWGVHPTLVAGHSAGEYAAAVVAGVLDLADGLRLIAARGRLMQSLTGKGTMAALFVDEQQVAAAVAPRAAHVGIAAVNAPATTVVSGHAEAVAAVVAALGLDASEHRVLDVTVPAHSPLVDPILDDFEAVVRTIPLHLPRVALVSSMTAIVVHDEVTRPDYWRRHLRQPVRFAAVMDSLRAAGANTFLEIGPHSTLIGVGQRCAPDDDATWVASMRRDRDEAAQLADALAALYVAGVPVDWARYESAPSPRLTLPTYPWQRSSYWSSSAQRPGAAARPAWPAAVAAAEVQAGQAPLGFRVDRLAEQWAFLDVLATAAITDALRALGVFGSIGARLTTAGLVADGRVRPDQEGLVSRWLAHLADDGTLERDGDGFVVARPAAGPPAVDVLARADAVFDGGDELLAYARRCVELLVPVVTGEESALSTLFPDGDYTTVDYLYHGSPVAQYGNAIVRAAVTAAASSRRLRVLEVGAGTGGTTAALLPALAPSKPSYVFTDVSDFFLAHAADRFEEYAFVDYARLDIEQPPAAQGFTLGGFDVIIASNVLHATRDLDVTLRHVHSLLAPGGLLVAYETTRHPRWFDITTGLIEGWQRFEDGWRDDNPLLPVPVWAEALQAAGFTASTALPGPDAPTAFIGQQVLLARAAGGRADAGPDDEAVASTVVTHHGRRTGGPLPPLDLSGALGDERHELLVAYVRRAVAHVLRLGDPGRIEREQPLLDVGFDSLMAVELRNVLRAGLGLARKLSPTLAFDYPNVNAMATYLDGLLAGAPSDTSPVVLTAEEPAPRLDPAAVADLSEAEAEAVLLAKLTEIGS
jgi:malonyl CoA-acyl carrier protein transacylase/SAM-dependent methyltransferase